jgi:hypothetical protein
VSFDRADRLDPPSADTAPESALPSASSIPSANSSNSSPAPASSDVAPEVPQAGAPPTPL